MSDSESGPLYQRDSLYWSQIILNLGKRALTGLDGQHIAGICFNLDPELLTCRFSFCLTFPVQVQQGNIRSRLC